MRAVVALLASLSTVMDDADRIDCIRQLEVLRGAVVAAQVRLTAAFVESQRAEQRALGVPEARVGAGISAQVALARRISPYQARRWVGFAVIAPAELPRTFAALASGETSEWRATLVARETAWLSREHRAEVDRGIAARLGELGDKSTADQARMAAYTLDPQGYVDHLGKADAERHVSLRPAPDVMTRLSALLPLAGGIAVKTALVRAADAAKATGDARTRAQIMADTLVERCTGMTSVNDVGVEVQVVLPADVLFADAVGPASTVTACTARAYAKTHERTSPRASTELALPGDEPTDLGRARQRRIARRRRARQNRRDEPALILGYGPIPAAIARRLVFDRSAHAPTWIRRVYECPDTGQLVAMESSRRTFTAGQRAFIATRDQQCRTPYCDAYIRHFDHVNPWANTHRTRIDNGDGLCEACNYAKQAPGWTARTEGSGMSPDVVTITPTGHRYESRAHARTA